MAGVAPGIEQRRFDSNVLLTIRNSLPVLSCCLSTPLAYRKPALQTVPAILFFICLTQFAVQFFFKPAQLPGIEAMGTGNSPLG